MNDLLIFILLVVFGLVPLGLGTVWFLYRKSFIFPMALTVFFASMFCAIIAFAVAELGWNSLYWAIPLAFIALVSANKVFKVIIRKPLLEHKDFLEKIALEGNLDTPISEKYTKLKHEIGDLYRTSASLKKYLCATASFADEIAKENFNSEHEVLSDNDTIGLSLINMRSSLLKAKEVADKRKLEEEQGNWITNGIAKFSDILRQNSDELQKIGYSLISNLVDYVGAMQGGLFVINEENQDDVYYQMIGAVAYGREKNMNVQFRVGESLVGRCAFERMTIYMTEVPDNYVNITSGLGDSNPRAVLLIPAILNDKVYAVIELASFTSFEPYQIEFLEKLGETIASTISSVQVNEQTRRLLDESKTQGEELAAQEEEMRQNLEELQATQEEMGRLRKEEQEKTDELIKDIEKHKHVLQTIVDKVPMKIFMKDAQCRMVLVNQKVLDVHNTTHEAMIGYSDFDFVDDQEVAQRLYDEEQEIIRSGKARHEVQEETINDSGVVLETIKMPFYIDYLDQTGILGIQRDITERARLQERVVALEAELAAKK